jgi:hypothetical protein
MSDAHTMALCPDCKDVFTLAGHGAFSTLPLAQLQDLGTHRTSGPPLPGCCGCGATSEELIQTHGNDYVAPFKGHDSTLPNTHRLLCKADGGWHV